MGNGKYSWTVIGGSPPDGISLIGTALRGVPTIGGYFRLTLEVRSDEAADTVRHRIRVYEDDFLARYLAELPDLMRRWRSSAEASLARNPHLTQEIGAKIDLLSDPDLEPNVLNQRLFAATEARWAGDRSVRTLVVFARDTMRSGALDDLDRIGDGVAVLEGFLANPWPYHHIVEWYGFQVGFSGGAGVLHMEDHGTFADRVPLPRAAAVPHELGHSYIGHEELVQFLEVYAHNVIETGSFEVADWTYTRGSYTPLAEGNTGVWALMDVYQLIGRAAMSRAYSAIYWIGAPYGAPLSLSARQAFVNEAPASARERVTALVAGL